MYRFGVSDECFHEITQNITYIIINIILLSYNLQRSFYVKKLCSRLNSELEIISVNGGAYHSLKKTLSTVLHHLVGYTFSIHSV